MTLTGRTKVFAVLGHPISHTLSPAMHNASFKKLGLDAVYVSFDVKPEKLKNVLESMHDMGFGGVNLTVPLKEQACRIIGILDQSAIRLGAVNTVEFTEEGMKGHNTDGDGFLKAFYEAFGKDISGLKIFVLGCGGAGRAIAITCAMNGAETLMLADIDDSKPKKIANEVRKIANLSNVYPISSVSSEWFKASRECDAIIHATPIGMKETDKPILNKKAFRKGQMVYDLIYMYPRTPFMIEAEYAGALTSNGLGMLLHQGAIAFKIWTGKNASITAMRAALQKAVYGKI